MNRVVVTGLGIVSSLGNSIGQVTRSLREGRSGMVFVPEMRELGYKCCVAAPVPEPDTGGIPKKLLRTMSTSAVYGVVAAMEAVRDAGLADDAFHNDRAGIILGSGGGGTNEVPRAEDMIAAGVAPARLGAAGVARIMNATAAANLAVLLGARGRTCSISAACTTGLYNIGHAYELVRYGLSDLCVCGSTEEETWRQVGLSGDNSRGMPVDFNDRPAEACRPYDRDRQGFVCSAGAAAFVLETLDGAELRGARVYAEIVGYGAANDAADVFLLSGEGLQLSIDEAMRSASEVGVKRIDYINSHGPGTQAGDPIEVGVIKSRFGQGPLVSSTKGQGGHAQGAAGAIEAVHAVLMLHHGFVAATANLENVAPDCRGIRHVQSVEESPLETTLTFNSGLGGTNATLIMRRL